VFTTLIPQFGNDQIAMGQITGYFMGKDGSNFTKAHLVKGI
jgi:hypothetical protein